jgi:hypothetical protein
LAGVAIAGPRRVFRGRWVWFGALAAVVLWAPWLGWQAAHGWPQLAVSRSIAAGGSTSSQPWWAVVPYQFLLVSPVLAPVWITGLVRLFRDPAARPFRFLAWAWVVLAVVFMATGGKPYYLAGLLPALLAAGTVPVDGWLTRGRVGLRRGVLVAAVVVGALVNLVIALPILPAGRAGPVIALNPDVGETIGWPELVATVADVRRALPAGPPVVILTDNYGEAGAIDRYGPALGLPGAYSGHNAYSAWGPPPDTAAPVITVGPDVTRYLRGCHLAARIADDAGIANHERGAPVSVCTGPLLPWSREWPAIRHYGWRVVAPHARPRAGSTPVRSALAAHTAAASAPSANCPWTDSRLGSPRSPSIRGPHSSPPRTDGSRTARVAGHAPASLPWRTSPAGRLRAR